MIKVAGAGPGNPKYLTGQVYSEIEKTDLVIAFGRIAKTLAHIREDIIQVDLVSEVLDELEKNKGRDILILASGDPNFYGIVNYLKTKGVEIDQVLPGLSSFQYMMAKLQKPWQDARLLSLHGRKSSLEAVREAERSIILTDKVHTPSYISKSLYELGIRGKLYAGFNLSYEEEERIDIINIGEEVEDISPLAIVVIENEMD